VRKTLLVALLLALGAAPALAQTAQEVEIVDFNGARYADGGETVVVIELRNLQSAPDPSLVQITANGQPVENLEVVPLGQSDEVPVGSVLVIDASGSMAGAPIAAAKTAAIDFISQMGSRDEIALVTFADQVTVLSGFTNNVDVLSQAVNGIIADGETAFNDGVIKGTELFAAPSARDLLPNMIVLTDGDDTVSVASLEEAIAAVRDSGARVFGVALESPDFNPGPVEQVAAAGDGLFLSTPDPGQLSALYGQISREISNTLVARFVSPVFTPGPVEFGVSYGDLSSSTTFQVSGYATTTTTNPQASTTTTLLPLTTRVVETPAPLDLGTLGLMGAAGFGLTIFLFLVILFGREDEEEPGRFAKRLQAYGRRGAPGDGEKKSILQRIPLLNRLGQAAEQEVRRRGLLSGVNAALEQANVPMSPGEAIMAMFGLAAVVGVFAAIFNGPIVGLVVFVALLALELFLIRFAGGREKKKFERQLPDTLTLLSTSLRAGYSLLQATEAVASEAQNPTAREFGRAIAEARLGVSVPDSLQSIVDRTQSKDFEWAVMAIEIQREVGGNLAEVLQTVADTMRARNRLKGEIRALTAEGRISAIVLGALPFGMFLFLWTSNRAYLEPLLDATFGRIMIASGLLLMAGGVFWLKKIVDIEI
jgi:tight adherence protein B